MKLRILMNRVKHLPPDELVFRFYKNSFHKIKYLKHKFRGYHFTNETLINQLINLNDDKSFINHFKNKNNFLFSSRQKKELSELVIPTEKRETIAQADNILDHRFNLLGFKEFKFENIDFNYDFFNEKHWPLLFFQKISTYDFECLPLWKLNRFYHFEVLGRAYWYTSNIEYYNEFQQEFDLWYSSCPFEMGFNWVSPIEVAIRAMNFTRTFFYFSDTMDGKTLTNLVNSIYQHALYLSQNFEYYSGNNNHLISNAAGLAFVAVSFPEFKKSKNWLNTGLRVLKKELKRQVYSDGVSGEGSFHYHKFVTDFYLNIIALAKTNKISLSPIFADRVSKMIDFIYSVENAHFGDDDGAQVFNYKDYLAIANSLFNCKYSASLSENTIFLLGLEASKTFNNTVIKKESKQSVLFKESQYAVMCNKNTRIIFDAARLGLNWDCGHGHSDILSFELFYKDQPIFVHNTHYRSIS